MAPTATFPRFRAVFFDLGGTLVDEGDYPRWVELGRACGLTIDESHLAHAYLAVERETDTPTPPTHEEFWFRVLTGASREPVDRGSAVRFYERLRAEPIEARLYSDSLRCLHEMRRDGRRLGVVSNSRSEEHLRVLLEKAEILDFFEATISSGTEGVAKPDPEIFRRAVARLGVPAAESFYVGNLAYRDAAAARAAGLTSVWLNREGMGLADGPPEILSLTELPVHLRSLEGVGTGPRARSPPPYRRDSTK